MVEGLSSDGPVKVKSVRRFANRGFEVTFIDHQGNFVSSFYLTDQQPKIELIWSNRAIQ